MQTPHLREALSAMTGRRILVTGASGAIGARLVRLLSRHGARVHGLLRPGSTAWRLQGLDPDVVLHTAAVEQPDAMLALWNAIRPDYAFHLATARGTGDAVRRHMLQVSIGSAQALIEAMRATPARGLVVAGSSMEYAPSDHAIGEDHPVDPRQWFAAAKAAASVLYRQAAQAEGLPICIVRLFHVHGPWESRHRLAPTALMAALNQTPLSLTASDSRRDWVYIDDACEALVLAALGAIPGEVFNIGAGRDVGNEEFVRTVEIVTGQNIIRNSQAFAPRVTDAAHRFADVTLARERLGWQPRHSLEAGLAAQLSWLTAHPELMQIEADQWEVQQ
ncbi:MAG: NAD(P)-dependent oxidoreductase [Burkholderiaceae bacterium]